MAMDLTGVSITTTEVREITKNIKQIGDDFNDTMKTVNEIMTTLTNQSEGGLIQKTTTAVEQLTELANKLVDGIALIVLKTQSYLSAILSNDTAAKETLIRSLESNLYN